MCSADILTLKTRNDAKWCFKRKNEGTVHTLKKHKGNYGFFLIKQCGKCDQQFYRSHVFTTVNFAQLVFPFR